MLDDGNDLNGDMHMLIVMGDDEMVMMRIAELGIVW